MTRRIRPAEVDDAHAIARVHVAGWQLGYRGLVDQAHLDGLDVEDRSRRWVDVLRGPETVLVHDDDGRVDAFTTFGPSRDQDVLPPSGEVYGLYVHPESWGRGIGGSLLTAAVARLLRIDDADAASGVGDGRSPAADDAATVVLWTLEGNRRARRFYERHGWVVDGPTRQGQRSGSGTAPDISFTEVRYRLSP